jgi:hypothetical protein
MRLREPEVLSVTMKGLARAVLQQHDTLCFTRACHARRQSGRNDLRGNATDDVAMTEGRRRVRCAARAIRVGYPDQSTHRIAVAWCSAGHRPGAWSRAPSPFRQAPLSRPYLLSPATFDGLGDISVGLRSPSQAASRCRSRLDRNSSPLHRQRSSKSLAGRQRR